MTDTDALRRLVQQWQPIETAPKDRTWVLVWQEDVGYAVFRFGPGLIDEPDDVQWTHWMPLPDPPTEVGDAGRAAGARLQPQEWD